MARLTMVEAVREALRAEMRRDPRVWALGEDLSVGGIYDQYAGLVDEFGTGRIVSTPISEAALIGVAVGAALVGTRPVVEMRMADFALCAMDELVNQAAKVRYMSGGQGSAPIVVRMPQGISGNSAAQHSQTLESWYMHVPGLVVLAPATPADAAGLLVAAIRCEDPVVFLEPRACYDLAGEVPDGYAAIEIGKARTARRGRDLTLVAWSSAVSAAMTAAEEAAGEGIDVEVIDLRSLWPWDAAAVQASVARTGRLLVAQESVQTAGVGAEILASTVEALACERRIAVRRLGAPRVPAPYSPPLEDALKLTCGRILAAIRALGAQPADRAVDAPLPASGRRPADPDRDPGVRRLANGAGA